MTRKQLAQAVELVATLVTHTRAGSAARAIVVELQGLLKPGPTIGEIILSLPSDTHKDRAAMIGISRQGYYNLIQGLARPNPITIKRLADLTGFAEDVIRGEP